MPRQPHASRQTCTVLATLAASPTRWRHGVSLTKETGVGPGTLYPLLARLADQGYLEARWEAAERPGRPPRHVYRLTETGRRLAYDRTEGAVTISTASRVQLA